MSEIDDEFDDIEDDVEETEFTIADMDSLVEESKNLLDKLYHTKEHEVSRIMTQDDLRNDVGFEPEYSFEKGIEETINWWRERI